jgi:hypothetical protein
MCLYMCTTSPLYCYYQTKLVHCAVAQSESQFGQRPVLQSVGQGMLLMSQMWACKKVLACKHGSGV